MRGAFVYWDASAVVSSILEDANSRRARAWTRSTAVHFLSSLAHAESVAVLARIQDREPLSDSVAMAVRDALDRGPWQPLPLQPDRAMVEVMAFRWPLRGADLWHLATALTLRRELPSLGFATFDTRLTEAAEGCGMSPVLG